MRQSCVCIHIITILNLLNFVLQVDMNYVNYVCGLQTIPAVWVTWVPCNVMTQFDWFPSYVHASNSSSSYTCVIEVSIQGPPCVRCQPMLARLGHSLSLEALELSVEIWDIVGCCHLCNYLLQEWIGGSLSCNAFRLNCNVSWAHVTGENCWEFFKESFPKAAESPLCAALSNGRQNCLLSGCARRLWKSLLWMSEEIYLWLDMGVVCWIKIPTVVYWYGDYGDVITWFSDELFICWFWGFPVWGTPTA